MRLDKLNGIQVRLQNSELKKQNCAFTPQDECEKDFVQVLMLIESCSERKKNRGVGGKGGIKATYNLFFGLLTIPNIVTACA